MLILVKSIKDYSHLIKQTVTDKNGHQKTVWVKAAGKENPAQKPATTTSAGGEGGDRQNRPTSLKDNIHAILNGTPEEKKALSQKFFHVADTPQFMKELGLAGDYFSIKYGAITRHIGKDSEHNLTEENWNELSDKITKPFAITKHGDGYHLFTTAQIDDKNIVVGVDVKKIGKDIEVNAIKTAFGKNKPITDDEVIYTDKKITSKQAALLGNHNYSPYPPDQKSNILSPEKSSEKTPLREKPQSGVQESDEGRAPTDQRANAASRRVNSGASDNSLSSESSEKPSLLAERAAAQEMKKSQSRKLILVKVVRR